MPVVAADQGIMENRLIGPDTVARVKNDAAVWLPNPRRGKEERRLGIRPPGAEMLGGAGTWH